jgi:putative glycosyltransferase
MVQAAEELTDNFELIFVNDGSPDNSLSIALELLKLDRRVKVIDLSRNFGHHKAIMTGLEHASGDFSFLIDCDLEEDPTLLNQFWKKVDQDADASERIEVVYGVQNTRKGGAFERWSGAVAWRIFDILLTPKVPHNQSTVRLMSKDYVEALVAHKEQKTAIGGLWVLTGFNQVAFPFDKGARENSSYKFKTRLHAFFESITSFSDVPLYAVFYLGVCIFTLSLVIGASLIVGRLFGTVLGGWTSIMVTLWLLGGLTVMSIGIVGLYISRIFIETKDRPFTIIRKVHGHDN